MHGGRAHPRAPGACDPRSALLGYAPAARGAARLPPLQTDNAIFRAFETAGNLFL
jgi:hypothetical protein